MRPWAAVAALVGSVAFLGRGEPSMGQVNTLAHEPESRGTSYAECVSVCSQSVDEDRTSTRSDLLIFEGAQRTYANLGDACATGSDDLLPVRLALPQIFWKRSLKGDFACGCRDLDCSIISRCLPVILENERYAGPGWIADIKNLSLTHVEIGSQLPFGGSVHPFNARLGSLRSPFGGSRCGPGSFVGADQEAQLEQGSADQSGGDDNKPESEESDRIVGRPLPKGFANWTLVMFGAVVGIVIAIGGLIGGASNSPPQDEARDKKDGNPPGEAR